MQVFMHNVDSQETEEYNEIIKIELMKECPGIMNGKQYYELMTEAHGGENILLEWGVWEIFQVYA